MMERQVLVTIRNTPWPRRRRRCPFSRGVLDATCRYFGTVPGSCDPLRSAAQVAGGRIQRLSHWTTPP